jgi:hypothetical protein
MGDKNLVQKASFIFGFVNLFLTFLIIAGIVIFAFGIY